MPQDIRLTGNEGFVLDEKTVIITSEKPIGELLKGYLMPACGFGLRILSSFNEQTDPSRKRIILQIDENAHKNAEGYNLTVTEDKVLIQAPYPQGLKHGIQTIRQLLSPSIMQSRKADNGFKRS